jgi:hypothetical protein
MWNQLTRADVDRVRQRLATQRDEMLRRHTEEIRGLDADEAELQLLEQLLLAFTKKHLVPLGNDTPNNLEQAMPAAQNREAPLPEPRRDDAVAPRLQVHHQPSPNFGAPFRKFVGG